MAIKFEVNEDKAEKAAREQELQEKENALAATEGRKPNDVKKVKKNKSALQKWSDVLLIFAIIAVVYAITYEFSGIVIMLPTALLYLIWFAMVVLASVLTVGTVWLIEAWRNFNTGFMEFNQKVAIFSGTTAQFLYDSFPYLASFFAVCVIAFLVVSIIGRKKQQDPKEGFKGKLITAIVFTVVFIVAIVFDLLAFVKA